MAIHFLSRLSTTFSFTLLKLKFLHLGLRFAWLSVKRKRRVLDFFLGWREERKDIHGPCLGPCLSIEMLSLLKLSGHKCRQDIIIFVRFEFYICCWHTFAIWSQLNILILGDSFSEYFLKHPQKWKWKIYKILSYKIKLRESWCIPWCSWRSNIFFGRMA